MQKDVIYIDVDDDVTAIIGKIKKAKEKVIALVPPKRSGALQSAVNLRLLDRLAKSDGKHLVLVTNNQALIALAASTKIPVAKNLQSKPELIEQSDQDEVVEDDDVIDGSAIPVGEHAKSVKVNDGTRETRQGRSDAIDSVDIELDEEEAAEATGDEELIAATPKRTKKAAVVAAKGRSKIPNFDSFRKKLFLGIAGGVALVALLVWALVFAPAANVIITASTSPSPINATVKLGGTAATDYKTGTIRSVRQQEKKDITVEFQATTEKDVGDKATGILRVSKLTASEQSVPAGSRFTSSTGLVFTTDSAVTIPASQPCFPSFCAQSVDVGVTAENPGTDYNGINGSASGPSGVSGSFQGDTSGGTSKMAKVVTADDIERAKGEILGRSTDPEKAALEKLFEDSVSVISSSFTVERGKITSSPAVNKEAPDGKAELKIETTFTMYGIPKNDLDTYIRDYLKQQLGDAQNQKIYSTGADTATLANFKKDGDTMTASISGTGRIGPEIDEAAIKEQVKGMRYGDVQSTLEAEDGIREVDVQFSYFWVRTIPGDTSKITITFKVADE